MPRNFDRRVEAVTPVDDPSLHPELRALLAAELADNRRAWDLLGDGSYVQRTPGTARVIDSQEIFLHDTWGMAHIAVGEREADATDSLAGSLAGSAPLRDR